MTVMLKLKGSCDLRHKSRIIPKRGGKVLYYPSMNRIVTVLGILGSFSEPII